MCQYTWMENYRKNRIGVFVYNKMIRCSIQHRVDTQTANTYKVATTACGPAKIMERAIQFKIREGIITAVVMNVQTMHVTKLNVQAIVCISNILNTFRVLPIFKHNYRHGCVICDQEVYFD